MKRVSSFIIIILSISMIIVGDFLIMNGSMDMYPTPEQVDEVYTVGLTIVITGIIGFAGTIVLNLFKDKSNKK